MSEPASLQTLLELAKLEGECSMRSKCEAIIVKLNSKDFVLPPGQISTDELTKFLTTFIQDILN